MMSSPTIKDVAKLAGVSISTVSRVMNDSKPVSPEARRKVLDAIEKLDFRPNELARSLVMKRSNVIGVVVKDIGIPYMAQIIRGLEEIGRMYNYDIMLSSTYGDLVAEKKIIDFMFTKQVEAMILISENINMEIIYKLKNHDIPFIALDKFTAFDSVHTVGIDYRKATEEMMDYLVSIGHKKVLFIKEFLDQKNGIAKLEGYQKGCEKHGLTPYEICSENVHVKDGYAIGKEAMEIIEKENITSVFASEDELAIGLINYCYDIGKNVPEDLSIVGFGDTYLASIYKPALTSVNEPYYDIGAVAMRKLIKYLKQEEKLEQKIILPTQIMVRESSKKIED